MPCHRYATSLDRPRQRSKEQEVLLFCRVDTDKVQCAKPPPINCRVVSDELLGQPTCSQLIDRKKKKLRTILSLFDHNIEV
uniref:Uncharacterized protein n=1 Tax=Salix viminalis TaxID=40686 RepID=A0A6N2N250_SALVM